MIILGISGFEDSQITGRGHVYATASGNAEHLLTLSHHHVPLQLLPLHLIGHDGAAALIVDGSLVSCASEERFTRIKHGFNLGGRTTLPRNAIRWCLTEAGVSWNQVDVIAHYCHFRENSIERRWTRVARRLTDQQRSVLHAEYADAFRYRLSRDVLREQLERLMGTTIADERLIQVNHHLAHAAGAFYSSNARRSLILTLDGYGEEESSIWAVGENNRVQPCGSVALPTSLGLLYQVISAYLGFRSFGDEYKVMGLSSYGDSKKYRPVFERLVELHPDGHYSTEILAQADLFAWLQGAFEDRTPHQGFSQKTADIAAALQWTLENTVLHVLSWLRRTTDIPRLCLSGGVALNACLNSAIIRSGLFKEVFIQPAASDDGASLGSALFVHHHVLGGSRTRPIHHVFWGPRYSAATIESTLENNSHIQWTKINNAESCAATLLAQGKLVGWFQGRMEMGPRALGARSILADPRSVRLRDRLNLLVKNRESFRPFAPSVLSEHASKFFEIRNGASSPFMLITFMTHEHQRTRIPGVVHVDGTARIQTVSEDDHPQFCSLLREFYRRTGIPMVLNTSFNRAGEPIVNSPEEALLCFLASGLDALIMENYVVVSKEKRDGNLHPEEDSHQP